MTYEFIKSNSKATVELAYFSNLFHATTQLHIDHFQADTYAKHIALEEAYEGLLKLLDTLIEVRQGESEVKFTGYKAIPFSDNQDSIDYLEALIQSSNDYRLDKSSNVQNLVDEILTVLNKTIYKLTFLK